MDLPPASILTFSSSHFILFHWCQWPQILFPQSGKTLFLHPHTSTPGRNSTGAALLAILPQLTFLLQRPNEWADWEGLRKTALTPVTTRLSLAMPLADQEAWQLGWGDSIQGEGMRKPNNGCRFRAVPSNSVLSAMGLIH